MISTINFKEFLKIKFSHARWGGTRYIEPKYLVIHHTAMFKNGAKYLANNLSVNKPSVQFHLDLDGTVTVYTNLIGLTDKWCRNANHAGVSRMTHDGETIIGLNGHSIGIEVEGDTNKRALTKEQREALVILCKWIVQQFPILKDPNRLIRHADCAYPKGRKVDIGLKYFLWDTFKKDVYDRGYKI
jgi:N-acetyl-anhydromuramyl-L-alanine amidase AmpD